MLIDNIRKTFKQALRSGKIYSIASKTPTVDFNQFNATDMTNNHTWQYFEGKELRFRKHLASKKINYGDFGCKGDIKHWIRLIKIFNSIFYENNVRVLVKNEHQGWSTAFLKYVSRILRSIPNDPDAITTSESLPEKICNHLDFIKKTLLPYFSQRKPSDENPVKVKKERLIDLWINKRKKAIKVINNNGFWPTILNADISIAQNESYYDNLIKYANAKVFMQREKDDAYFQVDENDVDITYAFSTDEIEKAVFSSPNGKSPGQDGVLYEDMKEKWNDVKDDMKEIFLFIIMNRRFPETWKKAIIQRIPKKTFTLTDLSTLRDISLLPTMYKVFSVCLCKRISPFIQRTYLKQAVPALHTAAASISNYQ